MLPSSITKAPINAEPEVTKIRPTSKRQIKPTSKLTALKLRNNAIQLVNKTTKCKEKAKEKLILKDTKNQHTNALDDLDSMSSVIMKKPGPKSKTMPLVKQKIPEIPAQETIDFINKTKKRMVAKKGTVQNSDDIFDGSTNKCEGNNH